MEARLGGVELCEVFDVGRCGWNGDGLSDEVVWVSWDALEDMIVIKSKFEVWWLVVGPEVIVGGTRDDLGENVIRIDSRYW